MIHRHVGQLGVTLTNIFVLDAMLEHLVQVLVDADIAQLLAVLCKHKVRVVILITTIGRSRWQTVSDLDSAHHCHAAKLSKQRVTCEVDAYSSHTLVWCHVVIHSSLLEMGN